jgi:putative hydrolase of the HAD superfamily
MKYQAVIFDLGDTLVKTASWKQYREAAGKAGTICGLPEAEFTGLWEKEVSDLSLGRYASHADYIQYICGKFGVNPNEAALAQGSALLTDMTRTTISQPKDGALELLGYLKSKGYKLGLVSDCPCDVPQAWPETPFPTFFDVTVFSCHEGVNKADPRIFEIVLERLKVMPEECLYIADGQRNELDNAAGLGMTAVQIWDPAEHDADATCNEWSGLKIKRLVEVYPLLGEEHEI